MIRSLLVLLTLVTLIVGCAAKPVISPDRWIEDYDYEQDFDVYLKSKFDEAISINRVPYAYVYADWCIPCVRLRNRSRTNPEFAKLFVETQIILLNYDELLRVKDAPRYRGVPLIIPIKFDGTLEPAGFSGIPWTILPSDTATNLCIFFELRKIESSTLNRNCSELSS